jgi:hypothetical protein
MKYLSRIIVSVLLIVVVVCSAGALIKCCGHTTTITKTVMIPGDSIPYPVQVNVPVPHDSIITDTVFYPAQIDTAEILKHYFSKYHYQDTIKSGSVTAILNEEVTQNRITNRQLWIQNLRPISVTNTMSTTESRFYAGLMATEFDNKVGLGPSILYARRRDAFSLNLDILHPGITAGYYIKFK